MGPSGSETEHPPPSGTGVTVQTVKGVPSARGALEVAEIAGFDETGAGVGTIGALGPLALFKVNRR